MEACFKARFPQEGARQGDPDPQEFITKTTQELQEARAMRRDRRLPGVAPHPGEDGGLHICIDIPGLNRVASLERLWPSRVGRYGGPPHSCVRMPYGLPNAAVTYQRLMRGIMEAQEARRSAALGGRSQLEMKLERCHLMTLSTKERRCSRRGGLREPILTSPQAQGPQEAPEVLAAPRGPSPSPPGLRNAWPLVPP